MDQVDVYGWWWMRRSPPYYVKHFECLEKHYIHFTNVLLLLIVTSPLFLNVGATSAIFSHLKK